MNDMNMRHDGVFWVHRVMLSSFVVITLNACGGDNLKDLKTYVAEVKARPKRGIKALPEIKAIETFIFNPEGLRDPFQPSVRQAPQEIKVSNGIKPDFVRNREQLEAFSLDDLRLVGIIDMSKKLWGLIRAGDGTIHRVRTGNYMGKNHGKILRVLKDKVELVEIIEDGSQSWRERQASIALAED